jgi:hypothetical protein
MLLAAVCTKGEKISYSVGTECEYKYTVTPFIAGFSSIWESAEIMIITLWITAFMGFIHCPEF